MRLSVRKIISLKKTKLLLYIDICDMYWMNEAYLGHYSVAGAFKNKSKRKERVGGVCGSRKGVERQHTFGLIYTLLA
jgi:hypothetical protein